MPQIELIEKTLVNPVNIELFIVLIFFEIDENLNDCLKTNRHLFVFRQKFKN